MRHEDLISETRDWLSTLCEKKKPTQDWRIQGMGKGGAPLSKAEQQRYNEMNPDNPYIPKKFITLKGKRIKEQKIDDGKEYEPSTGREITSPEGKKMARAKRKHDFKSRAPDDPTRLDVRGRLFMKKQEKGMKGYKGTKTKNPNRTVY